MIGAWREECRMDPTADGCSSEGGCCAEHSEVVVLVSFLG